MARGGLQAAPSCLSPSKGDGSSDVTQWPWEVPLRSTRVAPLAALATALLTLAARPQDLGSVGSVEQEIKAIDQQWLHAATIQDVDYLKQLFADGMFEVQNGGSVVTGAEMRRYLAIPGRQVQISIDQVEVRGIYGDTAILTDHTSQTGAAADGRKISGEYTVMRVLKKLDGKWRAIGANMTPLKASTSAKANLDLPRADGGRLQMSSVEREIVDLDREWADAATSGDTAFLNRLFADKMFEVQPDGQVVGANEILKAIATRKASQVEGYCDQIQVRGIHGDTAILTDRLVRTGIAADGRALGGQWRSTRVFVKLHGKWRAVAAAMTPIV
jgi:ketosteroid isomerase-like protein